LSLLLPFRRIARREDLGFKQGAVFAIVRHPRVFSNYPSSPRCFSFPSYEQIPSGLDGVSAQTIQPVPEVARAKKIEKCWRSSARVFEHSLSKSPADRDDLRAAEFIPRN
jgi:hypothetical protein